MDRHDDERNEPKAGSRPNAQPDPARPELGDATGTWAYVSPFATSPESYDPTAPGQDQPATSGSPGTADQPTWTASQPGQVPPGGDPQFGRPNWGQLPPNQLPPNQLPPNQPPLDQPPTWGQQPPPPNQPPTWGAPAGAALDGKPPSRWKTWQKVAAGGALVAVVGIGGVAAVSAASASSSDTSATQSAPGGQGFGGGQGFAGGDASGGTGTRGGAMAGAMELANALHGDFVVSSGSGTQTMRLQTGEITALSGSSLTVQSTDGYSSTWIIGSGVDVSSLSEGDTVRVLGTVSGDTATATSVTSGNASTAGGFGPGGMQGQGGRQAPEGMTPPNGGQAPQTS